MPNIPRPYRSPVGVPGALVTIVVALVTLFYQLQDEKYQKAVYAVAIFYVLGILYFAIYGRNQLILSPEEEFATSQGAKGHA
jgi:ethanolamine permease